MVLCVLEGFKVAVCWSAPQVLEKPLPDSLHTSGLMNTRAAPAGSAGQLGIAEYLEAPAVPAVPAFGFRLL